MGELNETVAQVEVRWFDRAIVVVLQVFSELLKRIRRGDNYENSGLRPANPSNTLTETLSRVRNPKIDANFHIGYVNT